MTGQSLGHQLVSEGRSVFVFARDNTQKKSRCSCTRCKTLNKGYRINTVNKNTNNENFNRHSKTFTPKSHHICKVTDGVSDFWSNIKCVEENITWRCACIACKQQAESNSDSDYHSVDESDADIEVIIKKCKKITITRK